jgi:hypothetical protein
MYLPYAIMLGGQRRGNRTPHSLERRDVDLFSGRFAANLPD